MRDRVKRKRPEVGIGVDYAGKPVVDPTANVLDLVEAEAKRQDGLREGERRYFEMQIKCSEEKSELRAEHAKEIRRLETDRLNSIRQVDVAGGEREAKRSLDAIQALAAASATNTETLRAAVTSTAQAIAKQTAETFAEVSTRLAALERSSYEGKGKEAISDPMIAELIAEMRMMTKTGAAGSGRSQGMRDIYAALVVVVTIILAALAVYLN